MEHNYRIRLEMPRCRLRIGVECHVPLGDSKGHVFLLQALTSDGRALMPEAVNWPLSRLLAVPYAYAPELLSPGVISLPILEAAEPFTDVHLEARSWSHAAPDPGLAFGRLIYAVEADGPPSGNRPTEIRLVHSAGSHS